MRRGGWLAVFIGTLIALSACASPNVQTPSPTTPQAGEDLWTSITWRRLDDADPRAQFARVVTSPAGLVAVGRPVAVDGGTRSPMWVSADGMAWQEVGADALGPRALVVGLHRLGDRLVALTMTGEPNECQGAGADFCQLATAPLRSWTSADGVDWAVGAEPLHLTGGRMSLQAFRSAASSQRVLITHRKGDQVSVAATPDGLTWQLIPPAEVLVGGYVGSLVALGDRFVATGAVGEPGADVLFVAWSVDGGLWRPPTALPAQQGEVDVIAVGRSGIVARHRKPQTGLFEWWSSLNGAAWSAVADFAPLGHPPGLEGVPNGDLVGDGDRMLAYDVVGHRGWTSIDGVNWQELAVEGEQPDATVGGFRLLPIGLLHRDDRGSWLAEPSAD